MFDVWTGIIISGVFGLVALIGFCIQGDSVRELERENHWLRHRLDEVFSVQVELFEYFGIERIKQISDHKIVKKD